ncbi:MAG TPA: hypothetical protein PLH02_05975 [Bacillota bacterium]|mgnify:CR=1 FL=1|nr:hypothetical protein [Bacillota bacterium]HPF42885.1 hypothetical protein [Bacillota bacterium]HPJ86355.1 hypothetical protein [Bacillota bacterium]HPQ62391.1 hypothetical protein [Bacillota bacterium]HRX92082.1 hypothetical protein [Candidatus Izemoplasmatales bacterium]
MVEFSRYYIQLFKDIWDNIVELFQYGIWENFLKRIGLDFYEYYKDLYDYSQSFTIVSWIMAIISLILNFSLIIFIIIKLVIWFRKYAAFRKIEVEKNELIEEIALLNDKVIALMDEKNQIMAMKVSQLGINASTGEPAEKIITGPLNRGQKMQPAMEYAGNGNGLVRSPQSVIMPERSQSDLPPGMSRFVKLIQVDKEYAGKDTHIYMEEGDYLQLSELVDKFVDFASSKLKLYYTREMIAQFFSGMAASKVMILEGISGTGKTSLPYAMGKFFGNNASIISVQPSWRDRSEMLGYLNEFTKRFNETEFLKALYEASYRKDVDFIVLDEMNLARIEYYFAEFLSIMEMPDPSEWKIDLVPDSKSSDPLKLINGKITVPLNVWFVGTSNKDDSTFTITDKVYDRAIALEFEAKGEYFPAPETEPIRMSSEYLQELFDEAFYKYPVSEGLLDKFEILDKYIQSNFKIAFGNRIMVQVHKFVPVYVACGGTEEKGLDYIFANKILRKFETLNLAFLQNELDQLINQIHRVFGKNGFEESIKCIQDLKKHI